MVVRGATIDMLPGFELLLAEKPGTFAALNPGNIIRYRNERLFAKAKTFRVYVSEFSIPDCIHSVPSLSKLLHSQEQEHQKIVHKVLKNAALIGEIAGYDYSPSHRTESQQ